LFKTNGGVGGIVRGGSAEHHRGLRGIAMSDDSESHLSDSPRRVGPVQSVRAVVVDPGFLGKGGFETSDRVRGIAERLLPHNIELWIPEHVIREWAAHANEYRQAFSNLRTLAAGESVSDSPSVVDTEELVEALRSRVWAHTNIVLIPALGEVAIARTCDQILSSGPETTIALTKNRCVQTGVVDSAWVWDAIAHADGNIRQIAFLTANANDVFTTTGALGWDDREVRVAGSEPGLFSEVLDTSVGAPVELTRRLTQKLVSLATEPKCKPKTDFFASYEPWFQSADFDVDADVLVGPQWADWEFEEGIGIEPQPKIVGIKDVRIDPSRDGQPQGAARYISFTLTLFGCVAVNGYRTAGGTASFSVGCLSGVLINIPCVIHETASNGFGFPRQTATGSVLSALASFDDDDDALRWTVHQLAGLEHVAVVDLDAGQNKSTGVAVYSLIGPAGQVETAELLRHADESCWRMEFKKSKTALVCAYDPKARVRRGRERFEAHSAYSVRSQGSREPHSAIGKVWAYLMAAD
jgi:hypothetical protein